VILSEWRRLLNSSVADKWWWQQLRGDSLQWIWHGLIVVIWNCDVKRDCMFVCGHRRRSWGPAPRQNSIWVVSQAFNSKIVVHDEIVAKCVFMTEIEKIAFAAGTLPRTPGGAYEVPTHPLVGWGEKAIRFHSPQRRSLIFGAFSASSRAPLPFFRTNRRLACTLVKVNCNAQKLNYPISNFII